MPDEVTAIETPETSAPVATVDAPSGKETPKIEPTETPEVSAAPFDWKTELETIDAEELRKHPRISGIIGAAMQRAVNDYERRMAAATTEKKRDEIEGELLKFTEDNGDYIRQHYPRAYEHLMSVQNGKAQREIDGLKGKTRHELAAAIGRAFHEIPEWKELTKEDHEALARAVMGKPDDEVIPLYNRHATDLVARRRAEKLYKERYEQELKAAKDAWKQEEAAKHLQQTDAPDTTRPRNKTAHVNVSEMTKEEFDRYWESLKQNR